MKTGPEQNPDAEDVANYEEIVARRSAILLELAREALDLDRRKRAERRKENEPRNK